MRHYNTPLSFAVVTQYYEAEVVSEYVIRGNAAILKCTIPSFVAEFVSVESWVGSDGSTFRPSTDYGTRVPAFIQYLFSYRSLFPQTGARSRVIRRPEDFILLFHLARWRARFCIFRFSPFIQLEQIDAVTFTVICCRSGHLSKLTLLGLSVFQLHYPDQMKKSCVAVINYF